MTDGLTIHTLSVHAGPTCLLDLADVHIDDGCITAVVGASGAGKTLMARALLSVSEPSLTVERVASRPASQLAWMPQQARTALDPYRTVGEQLDATHRTHPGGLSTLEALSRVGLDADVVDKFPGSLSGGMAQRVVLAQGLATGAKTLVVDEPTSGLDPLLAASVRQTLHRVADAGPGVLWITHDLRRITHSVSQVWVMHGGKRVEARARLSELSHPAARALIEHTPGLGGAL